MSEMGALGENPLLDDFNILSDKNMSEILGNDFAIETSIDEKPPSLNFNRIIVSDD